MNKKEITENESKPLYLAVGILFIFLIIIFFMNNKDKIFSKKSNSVENNNENNGTTLNMSKKKEIDEKKIKNFSAITESEFNNYFNKNKDIEIIDIRAPEEINTGKINKNTKEIDFNNSDFKKNISELDKNKKYFIYCAHGDRSDAAKEIMKSAGFKEVYDLKGGIATWKSDLYFKENKNKKIEDYKGKITFIAITSTSCPHCRSEVPKFKKDIFDKYGKKINFYVNVVNGGKWSQKFTQGYNSNLDYKVITGEECGYVPSWILLDEKGDVIKSMCGGTVDSAISILNKKVK